MRRILFFNYEYPPLGGGAANATAALMREFATMEGIEVDVVTSSIDSAYHREVLGERNGIRIHRLPIGKNPEDLTYQSAKNLLMYSWKAYWFARNLLKQQMYDGMHAFFTVPCGFLALLLRWQFDVSYIVSLRGSDVPGYSHRWRFLYPFFRPLSVFIWRQAHAVIANSRGLRDLALQSWPGQTIGVIPNGVDTKIFSPGESDIRDTETFTLLCASRLSRRKGFRYVIEALAMLVPKYPHIRLLIAGGEGDAGEELRQQVLEAKLQQKVTFFGHIPNADFPRYYRAADVFVFPSLNEGMSNSLLEALACGLPVIVTPTGGSDELVEEGVNGKVVPFQDSQAIAQALEPLIQDPEQCLAMGRASRQHAEKLSWRSVAKAYEQEYLRLNDKKI